MTTTVPARRDLDAYLHGFAAYSLMSAQEERSRAEALLEQRNQLWRAILSYRPLLGSILDTVAAQIEDEAARTELEATRRVLVAAVDRPPRPSPVDAREGVIERLCTLLAPLDRGLLLSSAVRKAIDSDGGTANERPWVDRRAGDRRFELWRRAVRCAHTRVLTARNQFVCANLRLVVTIAKRCPPKRMSFEDCVQEGNLGLMIAVDRFDPARGFRFSTYAAWWIRHAITRALTERARLVRVPSHLHTLHSKCERTDARLAARLGRPPTSAEIGAALGESAEKVELARRAMRTRCVSTEFPIAERGGTLADTLPDEEAPDVAASLDERRNEVAAHAALAALPDTERKILIQRFGLEGKRPSTLHAIGADIGVSRERIRQLQNRALGKLRYEIEQSPVRTGEVG